MFGLGFGVGPIAQIFGLGLESQSLVLADQGHDICLDL